jgi:hypothetical protein
MFHGVPPLAKLRERAMMAALPKKVAHADGQAHTIRMGKAPAVRPVLQEIGMM